MSCLELTMIMMMKLKKRNINLLTLPFVLLTLTACQTTLPVFEESNGQITDCSEIQQTITQGPVDYLFYANKMVDSMVNNSNVKSILKNHRIKIYLQTIENKSVDNIDIIAINKAVKNRILRSGQFIVMPDQQNADYRLAGSIYPLQHSADKCDNGNRKFTMSLTSRQQSSILWSEYKTFK